MSPSRAGVAHQPFVRRHLRAAHAILRPPLVELSVALVGDRRMSDLHEQFLGIPDPTDVLTFPMDEDENGHVLAGEVVVCVPEARRQAKRRNVPLERELLLYALHGMLHLCGYDDRTDAAFKMMHRTEDEILTRLEVGPVFAPVATPSRAKRTQRVGAAYERRAARHEGPAANGGAR